MRARKPIGSFAWISSLSVLQWGRALAGAETMAIITPPGCESELQWGRALAGAETGTGMSRISWQAPRFNGAAPLRARKRVYSFEPVQ